jgi:hypothetical protein
MSTTEATGSDPLRLSTHDLACDVFVNDPPPQDGVLPNGERKLFSPMASTLIYGSRRARAPPSAPRPDCASFKQVRDDLRLGRQPARARRT